MTGDSACPNRCPKIGFGMNVTVLFAAVAVFRMMYLNSIMSSAACSSGLNL